MIKYKLNGYLYSLFIALSLSASIVHATSYKYLDVTCSYQEQKDSKPKTFNWALLPDNEGRWVVKSQLPIIGVPELVRITKKLCMNTYSITHISFAVRENA
ncbi:MAG: hypothetical protein K0R94_1353, partial [Burkholderiales bacterium]|nr:hypothetical protein [Burkholderiales bacterium]